MVYGQQVDTLRCWLVYRRLFHVNKGPGQLQHPDILGRYAEPFETQQWRTLGRLLQRIMVGMLEKGVGPRCG